MAHRLWLLAVMFTLLIGCFMMRLVELQLVQGERLAKAVDDSRLVTEVLPPRRGRILDRHGTAITDNQAVYNLAVVLADLELTGRARREVPIYRLDEQRMDALIADLSLHSLPKSPAQIREVLIHELTAHPGVAVRTGSRVRDTNLALLTVPRRALAPVPGERDNDTARLAEDDLFSEDPRDAIKAELALRWNQPVEVYSEAEFRAAAAQLDQVFSTGNEHCASALEPFMPAFPLHLALEGGASLDLALRLVEPDRRVQAEEVLARMLNETPQLVHERLDRALAAARTPAPATAVYFAPSARAETIAQLLPERQGLQEIPIASVPGLRERVVLIQGDPPDGEGLFSQLERHLAASLGTDGEWIGSLLTRHAERIRPVTCERDYRIHHIVIDVLRFDRLCAGLASELTRLGRPTTRLDVEAALADARTLVDRAFEGQTRLDPVALFKDIPHQLAVRIAGAASEPPADLRKQYDDTEAPLPGLTIQVDLGREYPFPGSASHLIGTIGRGKDPEQESAPSTWLGRSGLELRFDRQLRGTTGALIKARTPDGVRVLLDKPPVAGVDLVTELDMELQTLAEDSLAHWYELAQAMGTVTPQMTQAVQVGTGKGRAGLVLIDCHTGAILTCASTPGYKISDLKTRYKELSQDPGHPLNDHAVEAEQPPGSSMKICTALACLEYNALNPGEEIYCQGYMTKIGDKKVLRDHAEPGSYDLPHAIQVSSNVYFATIAHRLGGERLAAFAELFGLGRMNSLDVECQRSRFAWGILPHPKTIALTRPSEPHWLPSDDWRLGIGQFATASPLQVVCFAAAVANGGHIVSPYLVKPAGQPEVKDLHIRKAYLDEVRHGMELVTSNHPHATASLLVLEGANAGIKIAAKTGTAEWGTDESRRTFKTPDHAWMIGYAPADNPTVAFACFIHSGTFGGKACTPVLKRVLERYFTMYGRGGHALKSAPAEE
jgi:penicillin-binding protein 2